MKKLLAFLIVEFLFFGSFSLQNVNAQFLNNTYKDIPVEVRGIPYSFKDICGNRYIDFVIQASYEMISTGQSSNFINFQIEKFIYDFQKDGSLILSTVFSYDTTPSVGNAFYPGGIKTHEWNLSPSYHYHPYHCSLDRYDDIAISQAKLNEMREDPSLNRVYELLLSVMLNILTQRCLTPVSGDIKAAKEFIMNNEQRIIGTWAALNGTITLVFNTNGTLTWDAGGQAKVYKFGVTDTMLAYYEPDVYMATSWDISISSDGKTLIMRHIGNSKDHLLIKK